MLPPSMFSFLYIRKWLSKHVVWPIYEIPLCFIPEYRCLQEYWTYFSLLIAYVTFFAFLVLFRRDVPHLWCLYPQRISYLGNQHTLGRGGGGGCWGWGGGGGGLVWGGSVA